MIDLIRRLNLPVLVVARSGLGTINHTLLTLEGLRYRAIRVLGVVMVGERNPENRLAIEEYGQIDVLGEIPMFETLTPGLIRQWACCELDRKNALLRVLK